MMAFVRKLQRRELSYKLLRLDDAPLLDRITLLSPGRRVGW